MSAASHPVGRLGLLVALNLAVGFLAMPREALGQG